MTVTFHGTPHLRGCVELKGAESKGGFLVISQAGEGTLETSSLGVSCVFLYHTLIC